MFRRKAIPIIDIIFCCVFLPLIITLVPLDKWLDRYPAFAITLLLFLYGVYFAVRKIDFPRLFMSGRYVRAVFFIVVMLVVAYAVSLFPYPEHSDIKYVLPLEHRVRLRAQTVWFLFLVVSGFSLSTSLMLALFRQVLVKKDIEAQKNKAELQLYKAQINPHFMFNTLNTLYGLVISKSERAEGAFVKFIDIIKYMYSHVHTDTIDVAAEIQYISHYVELQSLRLNSHTRVEWTHDVDDESARIPSMMLIAFVENAFKYGVSSTTDCEIVLNMYLKNGVFRFVTENRVMKRKSDNQESIGIDNCRSRLDVLYPDRYSLLIDSDGSMFKIQLTIQL